jgi:hypothetical protein
MKLTRLMIIILCGVQSIVSCKKMIDVELPPNQLTTEFVFSDSSNAASAVLGMYSLLVGGVTQFNFGNGAITAYTGLVSDELFLSGTNASDYSFLIIIYRFKIRLIQDCGALHISCYTRLILVSKVSMLQPL